MAFFGISEREAEASKQKYGLNVRSYKQPFGQAVIRGFSSLSFKLLIISSLIETIALLLGLLEVTAPYRSYVKIICSAAAAAVLAFVSAVLRQSSDRTLDRAASYLAEDSLYTVFRGVDGTAEISSSEIAVGDSVYVSSGDLIPADGIVEEGSVEVDQSVFGVIGQSEKSAAPDGYRDNGLLSLDNPYCLYGGTIVRSGSGVMKITAIGDSAQLARKLERLETEELCLFGKSFESLLKASGTVGAAAAAAAIIIETLLGAFSGELLQGFLCGASAGALALAASSLGGCSLACRVCAAKTVRRLEENGVFSIKPAKFEKASAAGLLITDKTGMLTSGEYTVSGFIDGNGREYPSFEKIGGSLGKLLKTAVASVSHAELLTDGAVCGTAPFDRAMLDFVRSGLKSSSFVKKQAETSDSGLYGVTVTFGGGLVTIIRGEPEGLLERCADYHGSDGKRHKITNKDALKKLAATISLSGKDVEAIAFSNSAVKGGSIKGSFTLIGFMALQDSYNDEAANEVKRLSAMGVRTILVTGGSRENAVFTVKYAGIKKRGSVILDSEQLRKISDEELEKRLSDIRAVARASVGDKLRLVRAAHRVGIKTCFAAANLSDIPVIAESDAAFAPSSAGSAVCSACSASAAKDKCGIKCAADFISLSRKFSAEYKMWLIVRIILAVIAAAAAIIVGF